ncbi:hypothetical protein ACF0H5_009709 [Mactra antiquata]
MANIIGIVGIVVTGVALLFAILACALPQWNTTAGTKTGIWQFCNTVGDTTCVDIDEDLIGEESYDKIKVMKAMTLLGIILTVPALVCGILVLFVMKDMKILFFVAGGIDILAGLFLMVAFAYYVDDIYVDSPVTSLGASFALDIVAWILAWVAGGLFIAAKFMDKE